MYLVDTNVWLERLLDQERSDEVGHFLDQIDSEHLFITDFAFHSIGLVMSKLSRTDAPLRFIQDAFFEGSVDLVRLEPGDIQEVVRLREQFNLDFDDAYQYQQPRRRQRAPDCPEGCRTAA